VSFFDTQCTLSTNCGSHQPQHISCFFLLKLNLLKLVCYCRTAEWSHIDIGGNCT